MQKLFFLFAFIFYHAILALKEGASRLVGWHFQIPQPFAGKGVAESRKSISSKGEVVIMVTGIALVTVERKLLRQATEALLKVPGVTEVYTVAGEYDLVVMIRVNSNAELSEVVAEKMTHDIPGITHTRTMISLQADAKVDLCQFYDSKNHVDPKVYA